ncbi:DNA-cytosine methyltransferase [Alcanivorax xiamenensis]|uniref:DNA (cytosine-5-)-methyltransferase n=1 Tax=Alcanivorax xiamenensis TaxID=1177156 RepID=A0ABQ6Y2F2_9GAMM|nr:DNA cytosine methyltransferase [Alcanivorax xiamenensis]KAF0802208.1 DNA-cytosine methyltransferase [Alcanivorax xiamenensis]
MQSEDAIVAVDLFCGVGGLTRGLLNSGIKVTMGVDLDPACQFPLKKNNGVNFVEADVATLKSSDIKSAFGSSKITLMAGCAPCQPFSTYSRSAKREKPHKDWGLLSAFSKLVLQVRPTLVTMENVPPLEKQKIFKDFITDLVNSGYAVDYSVVDCRSIGLPQSRKRLVLVASSLGAINIPLSNRPMRTVRDAIGDLPPISAGMTHPDDSLHMAASLSKTNLDRIRASKPGGTWRDWPDSLISGCHMRESGATFPSVYGRMQWDEPSPTITTQCFGYGNGRFGHPEQDRAISLREAAMLQGFPREYVFVPEGESGTFSTLGRLIGNAVPVSLGEFIGEVLVNHVAENRRASEIGANH